MMKRLFGLVLVLTCAGLVSYIPHATSDSSGESVSAMREIEIASFCANMLTLLEQEDIQRAKLLAEWRMSSAVKQAEKALPEDYAEEWLSPHLEEGLRRVIDYGKRSGLDPEVMQSAELLLNRLRVNPT